MELASTLAGESFSDHPRSVSPVVAAFTRAYNDCLDDIRRQDLLRCAADSVGTAGSDELERRRALRCMTWVRERAPRRRVLIAGGFRLARKSPETVGVVAARVAWHGSAHGSGEHRAALALLDELIAMRDPGSARRITADALTPARPRTESLRLPDATGTA
jgi:hypothetical protein